MTSKQLQEFEALQAWLKPDFDKQDLRNCIGLLLTRVKGLEERLADGKPYDEFSRIEQELAISRKLADDTSARVATLENQVKVLIVQNARLQDDMRELR